MVGIAGEDDLDAPDLINDQPQGDKAAEARLAPNSGLEPAHIRSISRTGNPNTQPLREKLGADESAAIMAQLIREIEPLPEDDLQPRAITILKAKNRLSADDAKLVEQAFAARMALGTLPEALTGDEPTSAATDPTPPQPPSATMKAVKPLRPRGRPRKVKAPAEQSAAPPVSSKPTIDDNPAASTHLEADVAPVKIEKSELTISEPRRHRDKTHLKFVSSQPCLVCGRSPADAHHLRFTQPRAMGRKVSDEFTVPLCRTHHRDNHRFGDEVAWWSRQGPSIPWGRHDSSGFRRGVSNEGGTGSAGRTSISGKFSSSVWSVARTAKSDLGGAASIMSRCPSFRIIAASPCSSNSRGIRTA